MANFYKIGTTSELGSTLNDSVANSTISSTPITSGLAKSTYYAYKDGYTSNSSGSQQGTGLGYQLLVCFWFKVNTTNRTGHLYVAPFFRRTDGYSSNNTLTVATKAGNSTKNWSGNFATSTKWQMPGTETGTTSSKLDYSFSYNTSGKASISVSITGYNETGSLQSITCSFTVVAPTISTAATATTISASPTSINFGGSTTITQDHTTNITTNITASFTGESDAKTYTLASGNTSSTVTFTPSLDDCSLLPTLTSTTATVTCKSYSGSTLLGTKTCTVKLNVPSSVQCTVSSVTANNTPSGGYKIGRDKPSVTVGINTSNAKGAYATKLVVNFGNETKTVNNPSRSQVVTASNAISSTSQTITATITDSRGRTSSKSLSITAIALDLPKSITVLTASRTSSAAGTASSSIVADDQGKNCRVKYTAISKKIQYEISAGNSSYNKSMTVTVSYKKISDSRFTTFSSYSTPSNNTGTVSDDFVLPINDAENAYVIRITVADAEGSIYRETSLSSSFILFDLHSSGTGLGIGASSVANTFSVGMAARFESDIYSAKGGFSSTSDEEKTV